MRIYRLTKKGRDKVKVASQERDALLDYLYPNKTAPMEELTSLLGGSVRVLVRRHIKGCLMEEVDETF